MSASGFADEVAGALRFLTRAPLRERRTLTFGAAAFPVVGFALGVAAALLDALVGRLVPALRDVAVVGLWTIATGALHYDGLCDTLDALGGATVAERLRIMKDSAAGTFGVVGLVLAIATKLLALGALAPSSRVAALLLAPTLARFAIVAAAFRMPGARPGGLGEAFVAALGPRDLGIAAALAALAAVLLAGVRGAAAAAVAVAVAAAVRRLSRRWFEGVTGDVLGAAGEIAESAVLVFFAGAEARAP